MPFIVGEVAATIGADTRMFHRAMGQVYGAGDKVQRLGQNMTRYLTLPFIAGSAAVFKFGSDFETELSKIEGLVGISRDQINAWKGDLRDMAGDVGKGPEELAQGLFFVTSAGFRGAEAMNVLEISAKASAAGLGEVNQVADLVTSAVNAYGSENLSAAQAADILTAAVREGKLEAASLATVMGRLLPIATQLGVSFDELAGFLATMSRTGLNANESSTALRGILSKLIKPTAQANEVLETYGLNMEELRRQVRDEGLLSVLMKLEQTFGDNEEALSRVFEDVEGLVGVLNILGQDADTVKGIMEGTASATGDLEHAFGAASRTGRQGLNRLWAEMKSTATALYEDGIKVLREGFDTLRKQIRDFRNAWTGLSKDAKIQILQIAGLLVAGGPLLMALGISIKAISGFASIVVSKFGAIATAVGLGVVSIQWFSDNWDSILAEMGRQTASWAAATQNVFALVAKAAGFFGKAMPGAMQGYFAAFDEAVMILQDFEGNTRPAFTSFEDSAKKTFSNTVGYVQDMVNQLSGGSLQEFLDMLSGASLPAATTGTGIGWVAALQNGLNVALGQIRQVNEEAEDTDEKMSKAAGSGNEFAQSLAGGMSTALFYGRNFSDTLQGIIKQFVSSAFQQGIMAILTGGTGGKGLFSSLFGGIFGGGKASGGPVSAGTSYLVGEQGPELFMPGASGTIIPNSRLGGTGAMDVQRGFERALAKHMSKLGPEQIWAMSQRGRVGY